jgi:hypothetical protein
MSIAPGRHTPVLFSLFPLKRPAPVLLRSRALGYGQNSHQRRSVPFLSPPPADRGYADFGEFLFHALR